MSTKYLDSTGLAYFWGKAKAFFQEKLVSGTNIKTINGSSVLGSGDLTVGGGGNIVYCTCSTAAGTVAKTATIVSGSLSTLATGDQVVVKFTNGNTATAPTLQVGSTGAKTIKRYGTTNAGNDSIHSWQGGSCKMFVYDGTYWQMCDYTNDYYIPAADEIALQSSAETIYHEIGEDVSDVDAAIDAITTYFENYKQSNLVSGTNIKTINNTSLLGSGNISISSGGNIAYCTCSTNPNVTAKEATIVSGSLSTLTTGCQAIVKFTNANNATNPTLKIGSTEAKAIKKYGTTSADNNSWQSGACIMFVYDGTYWQMCDWTAIFLYAEDVDVSQGTSDDFDDLLNTQVQNVDDALDTLLWHFDDFVPWDVVGASSGVCPLNSSSKVDTTYLPFNIHISTSDPTSADGNNGDVWIKYTASA